MQTREIAAAATLAAAAYVSWILWPKVFVLLAIVLVTLASVAVVILAAAAAIARKMGAK